MTKKKKIVSSKKELRETLKDSQDSEALSSSWFSGIVTRLFKPSQEMADNSTAAKQKAEKNEKFKAKMEVVKTSPENIVNEGIDKQEVNSDLEVQQQKLSAEVENKEKKKSTKPVKNEKAVGYVSAQAGFSAEEQKMLGTYNADWQDEKKLKKNLDNLENLQKDTKKLKSFLFLGKKGGAGVPESELFEALLDKYTMTNRFGGSRFYSFQEVMGKGKDEKLNMFQMLWLQITHPVEYMKYLHIKKRFEKELLLCRTGRAIGGKVKEKVNKGVNIVKEGKENVRNVTDPLKESPATKNAAIKAIKAFKVQALLIFKPGRNVARSVLEKETRLSTGKLLNDGLGKGKGSFFRMALKGQVPGVNAKMSGGFMVMEVVTRGLLEAIQKGDIGAFPRTIASSNAWIEAIPGVGSWRSVGRLFSKNGDPLWAKITDAGVNIVGDGILLTGIIGSVFSGGASFAAAVAARSAVSSASKSVIRRQVLKQMIKKGTQKGITKVTTKQGRKQLGKNALKGTGKAAANTGKVTLTIAAIQQSFERIFPSGTVKRVATKVAMKQLKPQQRRLVKMGMKNAA